MGKKKSKIKTLKWLKEDYGLNPFMVHVAVANYFKLFEFFFDRSPSRPFDFIADKVAYDMVNTVLAKNKAKVVVVEEDGKLKATCGRCGKGLRTNDVYCPYCGAEAVREQE